MYNKLNTKLSFYALLKSIRKKTFTDWIETLNYDETEYFLHINDPALRILTYEPQGRIRNDRLFLVTIARFMGTVNTAELIVGISNPAVI